MIADMHLLVGRLLSLSNELPSSLVNFPTAEDDSNTENSKMMYKVQSTMYNLQSTYLHMYYVNLFSVVAYMPFVLVTSL